jgi:integrase
VPAVDNAPAPSSVHASATAATSATTTGTDAEIAQLGQAPGREGQVVVLRPGQGDALDLPALRERKGERSPARVAGIERRCLVATLLVTGIRLGEALSLAAQSIDGPKGARRMRVVGKGGLTRVIPIDEDVELHIRRYLATRRERFPRRNPSAKEAPLFVGDDGEAMTRSAVQYTIARLYRRAGLGAQKPAGALVHALRHTFASQALETGADVVEVQDPLGHADLKTTRHCLQATADQLRDVVRAHPAQIALRRARRLRLRRAAELLVELGALGAWFQVELAQPRLQ